MITRFQAPNVYMISFMILKEEKKKSFNARLSRAQAWTEQALCRWTRGGNQKQVWARGLLFFGPDWYYFCWIHCEIRVWSSSILLCNSFLFFEFTMKSVDFKILPCLSQLESPPGMSPRPLWSLSCHQDTACKAGEVEVSQGSWFSFRVISTKWTYLPGFMA